MSTQPVYCGLDVSKLTLDAFCLGHRLQQPNNAPGWAKIIAWLADVSLDAVIVCEATGGYERAAVIAFRKAGRAAYVVQPLRVRQFAASMGRLAKTDKIDAQTIASYAQVVNPKTSAPVSEAQERLASLVSFRDQIKEKIVALENQLELVADKLINACAQRLLKAHQREMESVDKAIGELIAKTAELEEKLQKITAFPGVGRLTALALLAYLPELGCLSKRQVAALAGVAPYNRDSGQTRGKRSIHGGRANVRTALYMAAFNSYTRNPVLSKFYALKRSEGKPFKVAIVAVMRKLVIALNYALKNPNFSLVS